MHHLADSTLRARTLAAALSLFVAACSSSTPSASGPEDTSVDAGPDDRTALVDSGTDAGARPDAVADAATASVACGAPQRSPYISSTESTGAPTSVPLGGTIVPGLYHITSEEVFNAASAGSYPGLSDAIRIDAGKLYENRSSGLERRYSYSTQGTSLVLTAECFGDQPSTENKKFGYTATGTTLVLFKSAGTFISTFERVSN